MYIYISTSGATWERVRMCNSPRSLTGFDNQPTKPFAAHCPLYRVTTVVYVFCLTDPVNKQKCLQQCNRLSGGGLSSSCDSPVFIE